MAKYRRKAQGVDAVQFNSSAPDSEWPMGVVRDQDGFTVLRIVHERRWQQVADGDWIITEANGKQRVIGPEAFEAEFEAVVRNETPNE
jgi:hypothetical protein